MEPIRLTIVAPRAGVLQPRHGEPVTVGLPFPRGAVRDPAGLTLTGPTGHRLPAQTHVLDRWTDGSIRWAAVHTQLHWSEDGASCWLATEAATGGGAAGVSRRVSVSEHRGEVAVDTGVIRVTCGAGGAFPFHAVTDGSDRDLLDASRSGLRVRDADGQPASVVVDEVCVDEHGPVRAAVRWRGRIVRGPGTRWLDLEARALFFAGLPTVRLSLTIRNPRPARHPGNFWELGDAGSVLLQDLSLVVALPSHAPASVACSIEPDQPLRPADCPFEVYQESSGGERWDSPAHVNRLGLVPMRIRGYRTTSGTTTAAGLRADPVVVVRSGDDCVAAAVPSFWQNFPRAVNVRDGALVCGLWPGQFPDVHELQGGEQKTHDLDLAFGLDPVADIPLDWCRSPAFVRADPSWYCGSGAVPHLEPDASDPSAEYRGILRAALDGRDSLMAKREVIDEYGWRHFGDIYADHESAGRDGSPGSPLLVSHYNNQYDALAGFALQFLRSGDRGWWTLLIDLAAHVVDIDVYRAAGDKAAYSGGPFWHTCHYVDAGRSTHRSYPRAPGVAGGGPSNEHTYTGGLVLHYFLTGDLRSRDTVVQLAEWVLRIDDGARTPFCWIDRGETGLASATRDLAYHGPGRGAANSISTLLDAYRLTANAAYLSKAEALIRRCIHPQDRIEERNLLNAEERWSYTVFLQVLGRYLHDSAERGATGRMYAWARESLVAYARWMAVHERPYLDTPEQLEHPTETWAAQDIRKCEVLLAASLHCRADERRVFRERAAFFFHTALSTLASMPTRTLARPVVILLGQGFRKAWFDAHPDAAAPDPAGDLSLDFGQPARFVPQRLRAVARAKRLTAAVGVAGLVFAGWLAGRVAGVL